MIHARLLRTFLILFSFIILDSAFSQTATLSGYVKDVKTGETLIGVNVFTKDSVLLGATTNTYGFFSLTVPKGVHMFRISFVGYNDKELNLDLTTDKSLNVELSSGVNLQEVVINAESADKNVRDTKMGTISLSTEYVKKIPIIFGESDILKAIQLLPGVKAIEGSSGLFIRGGGVDQNLILLDEAIVYNPGHLLGFFSIFNSDAIKNTTLIKGGMPAQYGGRLSSVLDIQMKEGNDKEYVVEGGIGLIASRVTVQGPIVKNKSSFIVSARRTYALDLAQPFINKTKFAGSNYYFYDINAKLNYTFSEKDRVYFSAYFGRDVFTFKNKERDFTFDLPYGNATATLRWNHVFSPKLFLNVSGVYNDYNFSAGGGQDVFKFQASSGVKDWNAKVDFDYFKNNNHTIRYGLNYTYHQLSPSVVTGTNGDQVFTNSGVVKSKYAHELALYVSDDWKISNSFTLNYGTRLSGFTQVGPYTSDLTGVTYTNNQPVKTYTGFEPRITGKYSFNDVSSLKFGFTATTQYVHLVSNSTSTLPADVWVPSSDIVKPQRGTQYALGYFHNFNDNMWETSLEVYYKDLQNQIDYPENYVRKPAEQVENSFVFGSGKAYGTELYIRKAKGRLTGWVAYTWARTLRTFPDINNGREFPSSYDIINDLSVVATYQLSRKWDLSANFVYTTGKPFTPLKELFIINNNLNLAYGERNSLRLPAYHRLDFGANYVPHPEKRGFAGSWTFSVYNVYNQLNPFFLYYDVQTAFAKNEAKATAYTVTLFPIIPAVTWNYKFQTGSKKVY